MSVRRLKLDGLFEHRYRLSTLTLLEQDVAQPDIPVRRLRRQLYDCTKRAFCFIEVSGFQQGVGVVMLQWGGGRVFWRLFAQGAQYRVIIAALACHNGLVDVPVHVSTIHRWRLKGVRGVRLETFLRGGIRYTTDEAIERFFAATTAAADGNPSPTRTARQRQRDIDRADAELREAGI